MQRGHRRGSWSWNKKHGLVRQRVTFTPKAKEDGITKYCKRDENIISFYFLGKNSLGSWHMYSARFLGDH